MSKIPSVETMGTCPKCGILLDLTVEVAPEEVIYHGVCPEHGAFTRSEPRADLSDLVLRFHLRLAYAVSKLLLRKFLVAALNQTRNQLGAALKTGTFRVAVHRLRPSIDLAGFSGVYLCFGRLGQPNSSRDNKALSFWASVSVLRLLAVL